MCVCSCVCFVSKIFVFLENQPIIIISFVHHHHLCHFFSAWNNQTIYGFRHLFIKTIDDDDDDEDDDDNYRSQINRKIGLLLFVVDHQFFLWPFFSVWFNNLLAAAIFFSLLINFSDYQGGGIFIID